MKLEINLKDEKVTETVDNIQSLVGENFLTIPISVTQKSNETNREYLKRNFAYLIRQVLKNAGDNKNKKTYSNQIKAIPEPVETTLSPDTIEVI